MRHRVGAGLLHPPSAWSAAAPILLVHGAHHGAACWDCWTAVLASRGMPAATLDLRGHGALTGEGLDPRTGVMDYAEDVAGAARALPRPPVLVGHSLGALVVLAAAKLCAPAVALVLVAPSPPGNLPGVAAVPPVPEGQLRLPPPRDVAVARWMGGVAPPPEVIEPWLASLCAESPRALNERYTLAISLDPAAVRVPVLVMEAGRDDAERHPAGQDRALATFLAGEHLLLPDAPHCLMLGAWCRDSASRLADWLERRAIQG